MGLLFNLKPLFHPVHIAYTTIYAMSFMLVKLLKWQTNINVTKTPVDMADKTVTPHAVHCLGCHFEHYRLDPTRVTECQGSQGYIRVKKWPNVAKRGQIWH